MTSRNPTANPFDVHRVAVVEAPADGNLDALFDELPVDDLVQGALNETVERNTPQAGLALFGTLDERGDEAWWRACALLLDFMAANPVNGVVGPGSAAAVREQIAVSVSPQRQVLMLIAEHRESGRDAARQVFNNLGMLEAEAATRMLFVMAAASATSSGMKLRPDDVRALATRLLP